MPKERVTMRKVRDILRLVWACGQSRASVSKSCGVSKTTVTDTVRRAVTAKLSLPLPTDLDDSALETLLYPYPGPGRGGVTKLVNIFDVEAFDHEVERRIGPAAKADVIANRLTGA